MSINHYSSKDLSETQWWSHYVMESSAKTSPSHHHDPFGSAHHLRPNSAAAGSVFRTAFSFNLNKEEEEESNAADEERESSSSTTNNNNSSNGTRELSEREEIPKEPLFEKPLTPSDVGKLNRLVIPKQHAEKHFPLNGGGGGAESGENGLLLSFEDELGKSWRFRYSYWNSSQSYVLTKGWSRFVKEKRLDAGDVVVFSRHRGDAGRLFIGWRRRHPNGAGGQDIGGSQAAAAASRGGWGRQMFYSGQYPYQSQQHQGPHSLPYQPECLHAGSVVQNQAAAATASGNLKTVRLFGVNLECQPNHSSEPSTPVGSPMSSQGQTQHHHPYHHHHHHHHHHQYYSNNHMDISFSGGDVYRQG